jgi:hypothetical protein
LARRQRQRRIKPPNQDVHRENNRTEPSPQHSVLQWQNSGMKALPEGVGKYSRRMDTALPGKHTRVLYDGFKRKGASVLAQLRTGMARLNGDLYRIGAAESDRCAYRQAKETIKHFLFRCTMWTTHRTQVLQQTHTRRGSLSCYLGGKALSDPEQRIPNMVMDAVRATVKYAIATGRLDIELESNAARLR